MLASILGSNRSIFSAPPVERREMDKERRRRLDALSDHLVELKAYRGWRGAPSKAEYVREHLLNPAALQAVGKQCLRLRREVERAGLVARSRSGKSQQIRIVRESLDPALRFVAELERGDVPESVSTAGERDAGAGPDFVGEDDEWTKLL